MSKKYKCDICNKEINTGNICDTCSERISGFINSIKQRLKEAQEKRNKNN